MKNPFKKKNEAKPDYFKSVFSRLKKEEYEKYCDQFNWTVDYQDYYKLCKNKKIIEQYNEDNKKISFNQSLKKSTFVKKIIKGQTKYSIEDLEFIINANYLGSSIKRQLSYSQNKKYLKIIFALKKYLRDIINDLSKQRVIEKMSKIDWKNDIVNIEINEKDFYSAIIKLFNHIVNGRYLPLGFYQSLLFEESGIFTNLDDLVKLASGESFKHAFHTDIIYSKSKVGLIYKFATSECLYKSIRRAQIRWLGCDIEKEKALMNIAGLLLERPKKYECRIKDFIQYIGNQTFLNPATIQPLFDFAMENPNVALFGRPITSIINDMENWHKETYNKKYEKNYYWDKSKINNYSDDQYAIIEINSYFELCEEGKKLEHCVASYANKCKNGNSIIFSLREFGVRFATIQVCGDSIVQIRGKRNKILKNIKPLINKWSKENNLIIKDVNYV